MQPLVVEEIPKGPNIMVLDEEEIENDAETVLLQRKRRRRASIVYPKEVKRLFRKSELAEKTDPSF